MKPCAKIIATIGPSSDSVGMIRAMHSAGMSVARLNFSHGSHDYFKKVIARIRSVNELIAIMLDTKGPEIRTGKGDPIKLYDGKLVLLLDCHESSPGKIAISYHHLDKLMIGTRIVIDEGLVELSVVKRKGKSLLAKVIRGGVVTASRKVTICQEHPLPFISAQDRKDILFGIENNVDFIAASFVRHAKDVKQIRKMLAGRNSKIKIISKIEGPEAVKNLKEIMLQSDGLMVARGDLGVEMPMEKVPKIQAEIIKLCNKFGKPVVVATQMLESMKENSHPTRAEVSDVSQAAIQGADAVMLSGETAAGKHPLEAVKTMASIVQEYSDMVLRTDISDFIPKKPERHRVGMFVTNAAFLACKIMKIKAIVVPTDSGFTARNIAMFRPLVPVIAFTSDQTVLRQLQISWGLFPELESRRFTNLYSEQKYLIGRCFDESLVGKNDSVVFASGSHRVGVPYTNLVEILPVKAMLKNMHNHSSQ
jgi:pyruvate kinase